MRRVGLIAFCPGFRRGPSLAYVSLFKPRYERFERRGLHDRLSATDSDARCGVQVIEVSSGTCLEWLLLDGPVGEIVELEVLPTLVYPMAMSLDETELLNLLTLTDRAKPPTARSPFHQ